MESLNFYLDCGLGGKGGVSFPNFSFNPKVVSFTINASLNALPCSQNSSSSCNNVEPFIYIVIDMIDHVLLNKI